MEDKDLTPLALTKMMKSHKQVLDCEVKVSSLTQPEITVYIKLYFWHRLRAVLYSDYCQQLVSDWGLKIIDRIPLGTTLNLKITL